MEKKVDSRIVKTEKAIRCAFFELMNEIGFSKISVQKIVERAKINRNTFYTHYIDKFDLLDKVEDDLLKGLKNVSEEMPTDLIISQISDTETLIYYINHTVNYMYKNGKVYDLLMSDKGDPVFINKLSKTIKSAWIEKNLINRLSIPQSYAFAALVGMTTSLIAEWVKSGFRESPEEFVQIVLKIIKGIPRNIFS